MRETKRNGRLVTTASGLQPPLFFIPTTALARHRGIGRGLVWVSLRVQIPPHTVGMWPMWRGEERRGCSYFRSTFTLSFHFTCGRRLLYQMKVAAQITSALENGRLRAGGRMDQPFPSCSSILFSVETVSWPRVSNVVVKSIFMVLFFYQYFVWISHPCKDQVFKVTLENLF